MVLVCVCPLTKMVRLIPCAKGIDAEGTATLVYKEVWKLFGVPRRIISDRDPLFTSSFWSTFMRLIRTRLNMSTAYHAETDGQTERMDRTVEEVLRHYVDEQQTNWDELLPLSGEPEYGI